MGTPRFENDLQWAEWTAKNMGLACSGDDLLAACASSDAEPPKERGHALSSLLAITAAQATRLRGNWVYRRKGRGNGNPNGAPPVAQIGELGEAANMFSQYQALLDKKARVEEQLAALNSELAKYQPIANVIQSVRTAVKNAKDALEVRATT